MKGRGQTLALSFGSLILALVMVALSPTVSQALLTGSCDSDLPGTCTKSLSLVGTTLTITLTNTSPAANNGFLTADAFDLAGAVSITVFTPTDPDFSLVPGPIDVNPFGTREFVITATPGMQPWLGGGGPDAGIPAGGTATFTLTLSSAVGITESDVFNSEVIRFRGFTDGGSDKDHVNVVPEPSISALLMMGLGLVGLAGYGWRRRKREE